MLTKELKLFAEGNLDLYVAFAEYYNCKFNGQTPSAH